MEAAMARALPAGRRDALPPTSPRLLRPFWFYTRRYLARHFHAVRLSRAGAVPDPGGDQPLVVYLNHASWWDPLIGLDLALRLFPKRRHHSPIDAGALARYRFFERLGFFGVEQHTARGARRFLEITDEILAAPRSTLWLTPEGRFTDPRLRPVTLAPGLAHLARRMRRGLIVPLALEYPFWEERLPEALARFGGPIEAGPLRHLTTREVNAHLEARLESTQNCLAVEAQRRDPASFETLISGRAGTGGVYELWNRLRARLRGGRFDPEHGSSAARTPAERRRGQGR